MGANSFGEECATSLASIFRQQFDVVWGGNIGECTNMKVILDVFCRVSGHKVNSSKSQLCFSKNMNEE